MNPQSIGNQNENPKVTCHKDKDTYLTRKQESIGGLVIRKQGIINSYSSVFANRHAHKNPRSGKASSNSNSVERSSRPIKEGGALVVAVVE